MRKRVACLVAILTLAMASTAGVSAEDAVQEKAEATGGTESTVDTVRWITEPICTATMTTLSCTGRAAGVQARRHYPIIADPGPPAVALFVAVRYLCLANGSTFTSIPQHNAPRTTTTFHNGQSFTIDVSPPDTLPATPACLFPSFYVRLPGYFDVRVEIGWAFGSCCPLTLLRADIGTVMPEA